jgi:SHS2 domain-containing protein
MAKLDWLDHTADVGASLEADSLEALFRAALDALTVVMMALPPQAPDGARRIELEADSLERLMVRWLEEWIFLVHSTGRVPVEADLTIEKRPGADGPRWHLAADVRDATLDPDAHEWKTEVKGATYHGLDVRENEAGWRATVVFDV